MEPISQHPVEKNMTYQVVYEREDGTSAVESCSTLDDAVVSAERLRNEYGIERPRIFETNEIRYDFQPYFRIHVVDEASGAIVGGAALAGDAGPGDFFGSDDEDAEADAYVSEDAYVSSGDDVDWTDSDVSASDMVEPAPAEPFTIGRDEAGLDVAAPEVSAPTAAGGVDLPDADAGLPEVDAGMPDLPDADAGLSSVDVPDSAMPVDLREAAPDVDLPNADIDLTEAAAPVGEKKEGLFSKFVDGLEGGSGSNADDVIDDLGSATDAKSNRGLFGR